MKQVFADTNYWVAVLDPRDAHHALAEDVSNRLGPCRVVTSEFVLLEMMKLLVRGGLHLKKIAYDAIRRLKDDPNVEVVPATALLFREACEVYVGHADKEWDGIDSASYHIMKQKGITEALTFDHHFEEMGFRALLREARGQR